MNDDLPNPDCGELCAVVRLIEEMDTLLTAIWVAGSPQPYTASAA